MTCFHPTPCLRRWHGCALWLLIGVVSAFSQGNSPRVTGVSSVQSVHLGVCFNVDLNPTSAQNPLNYSVPGAPVREATLMQDQRSVLLRFDQPFSEPRVSVSGVLDSSGNPIPPQTVSGVKWADSADIGSPNFLQSAFSCREGQVDVIAGGAAGSGLDELQYVYTQVMNDFDVMVEVRDLDPIDVLTKAGLMVRESLNPVTANLFVFTTPDLGPGGGVVGASRRFPSGNETESWGGEDGSSLPGQWLRLRRQGNVFSAYYGDDGINWNLLAQTNQFLPSSVLVGMATTSGIASQGAEARYRNFQFASTGSIIAQQPSSQVVDPGSQVTLTVEPSGPGPYRYQWRLNGQNLLGAVDDVFTLTEVLPKDGGTYTVVVINGLGVETSIPAVVEVTAPTLDFGDDFQTGDFLDELAGTYSGSNRKATLEPMEPLHAGKVGGASVWVTFAPGEEGIASFTTAGSSFDTLLAVYKGDQLDQLVEVISNDDEGDYYSSKVQFNVESGEEYHIAVDGLNGAEGNIVLCWDFKITRELLPEIVRQPVSQSVLLDNMAVLQVDAVNVDFYQWYFNGIRLPDETEDTLNIDQVTPEKVGVYRVDAIRFSGQGEVFVAKSTPAVLEIGPVPSVVSQDKIDDLPRGSSPPGAMVLLSVRSALAEGGAGPIFVGAGSIGTQVLNNTGASSQVGESNHCGVLGGASRWLALQATNEGTFIVDSLGSDFDTVLAVYTRTNPLADQVLVTCDNDGAPDGLRSLVSFPAQVGLIYEVGMDGVDASNGVYQLNWRFGVVPQITSPPSDLVLLPEQTGIFQVSASGDPAPSFQWQRNGVDIPGADKNVLEVPAAVGDGAYTVVVSNMMGSVTSREVNLRVAQPFTMGYRRERDGQLTLLFPEEIGLAIPFVIEATTDFHGWLPIRTNGVPDFIIEFADPDMAVFPRRFYRVIPPGM